MQKIVLTGLFERYAEERGIEATEEEIDAYVDTMRRGMRAAGLTAEDDLTPEETAQVNEMRRSMGRSMIRQLKLNRAIQAHRSSRNRQVRHMRTQKTYRKLWHFAVPYNRSSTKN